MARLGKAWEPGLKLSSIEDASLMCYVYVDFEVCVWPVGVTEQCSSQLGNAGLALSRGGPCLQTDGRTHQARLAYGPAPLTPLLLNVAYNSIGHGLLLFSISLLAWDRWNMNVVGQVWFFFWRWVSRKT